jgi:hypothetical protein
MADRRAHGDRLVQEGRRGNYFVFMIIPNDVRPILGRKVVKKTTGTNGLFVAHTRAAPVIASVEEAIRRARETLKPPTYVRAEPLVERLRQLHGPEAPPPCPRRTRHR